MSQFTKYQHLERLGTTGVEGIQSGEVYVFPKLDGANGSVWRNPKGELKAGSRNRELTLEKDNSGFYKWVLENENKFTKYFNLHPNNILYGEWLVPHSLKTYREDAWRNFYVFDVSNPEEGYPYQHYLTYSDALSEHAPDLSYLTPLAVVKNKSDEDFRVFLERNTYLIEDSKGFGEGIVLKNYDFSNKFGQTVWAKIIANHFKEQNFKAFGPLVVGGDTVEEKIVKTFVTPHLVDKVYYKINTEMNGWESKYLPRLINSVFYDLITEETWEILKKFNNPKIDFKYLQRLTTQHIKDLKKELF